MSLPTSLNRRIIQDLPEHASRAAEVLPTAAASPYTIFTIAGGPILLHGIFGRVTTVLSATVTSLSISLDPDVGAALDLCAATVVTSDAANTIWSLGATLGGALTVTGIGAALPLNPQPFLLTEGIVTITTTATQTGAAEWFMLYQKLHENSSVVESALA